MEKNTKTQLPKIREKTNTHIIIYKFICLISIKKEIKINKIFLQQEKF